MSANIEELVINNSDVDYHEQILGSGFGDMLHDVERNQKYYAALKNTVQKLHRDGKEAHVLDIGTGTGILSMMAVSVGADSVTACEAFLPMANCAECILHENKMNKKITLLKKHSTKIIIGVDMMYRANVLVTEIFDTELIGEGAIAIYNHAHKHLLTEDVVCIPASATCYVQVVQSPLAAQWSTIKVLSKLNGTDILLEPLFKTQCKGGAILHDLQLSQLPLNKFIPISDVISIFEFNFSSKQELEAKGSRNIQIRSLRAGSTDLVFFWWHIKMDIQDKIILSCAPFWAQPNIFEFSKRDRENIPLANAVPWRDHWMQALYYISKPVFLIEPLTEFTLSCNHDEFSFWFDVFAFEKLGNKMKRYTLRPSCTCNFHITYSRNRIGQINELLRTKRFIRYLKDTINRSSKVLVLGDGCLLGLLTSKLGAQLVIIHEPHRLSRNFIKSAIKHNNIDNVILIENLNELNSVIIGQLTHVFSEPYFLTSILPWENLKICSLLQIIKNQLSPFVRISPHVAIIRAVPVEFLNLNKINKPIANCEGFNLSPFDDMVTTSINFVQRKLESQPLWEYPCIALAEPTSVLKILFSNFDDIKTARGYCKIQSSGTCNGIALWVDWTIEDNLNIDSVISTGPTESVCPGKYIKWNMFVRQGVQLIRDVKQVKKNSSFMEWSVDFQPALQELLFKFYIHS